MLERRYIPDSENRLVILYSLDQLGGVTELQLLRFLTELDLMNYFDMKLNLCDLQERGKIGEEPHPIGALLSVTDEGRLLLEDFERRIPASRKEMIAQSSAVWRASFRREQQTLADVFPLSDGSSCARLRLLEQRSALLDAVITLHGEHEQQEIRRRWLKAASDIYAAVSDALAQGFTGDYPEGDLPANAVLQQMDDDEWLLSLTDEAEHPKMTLMLTLPDEALARHYAFRWPEQSSFLQCLLTDSLEA